jgi:hypothetical protein
MAPHVPAEIESTIKATTMIRRSFLAVLLLALAPLVQAAPIDPPVRAEIDALFTALDKSGCDFGRNGTWYPATDAKSHIKAKLAYFEGKGEIKTTENFIDLAASSSSASGKPYLVRCGGAAPVESRKWLTAQLATIRANGSAAATTGPK